MTGMNVFLGSCKFHQIPYLENYTKYADLSNNYIQELNSTSFPLLEQLIVLFLSNQFPQRLTVQKNSFKNLLSLQKLDLSYNNMLVLDLHAFGGLSRLHTLMLTNNSLNSSILENDYFKELVSLQLLELSFNQITYLKPNPLFYYLHSFQMLVLSNNRISSICEGDLHSFQLKTFIMFDLSYNHFYSLDDKAWNQCGNPFRNIKFDTLDLSSNGFSTQEVQSMSRAINGTQITYLKLNSNSMGRNFGFQNLPDPDPSTFAGLANSNLQILNLSRCSIFTLQSYVFANLSTLRMLDLSRNKINQISKNAFLGLDQLETLYLSNNLLGELYDNAFDGLTKVSSLFLDDNHIGIIQSNTFKEFRSLLFLDLHGNAIASVVFCESMPFIYFINLKENKLKKIDSNEVKSSLTNLAENRLEDLGVLYRLLQNAKLEGISLKQNQLSICYTFNYQIPLSNSLQHLDLSHNMVQLIWDNGHCLNLFDNLTVLTTLNLQYNYLQFLPDGIFSGLTSLQFLNLSGNLLKHLMPGIFPSNLEILDVSNNLLFSPNPEVFLTLKNLSIGFNRFVCDCPLVSFLSWLNQTNVTIQESPNDIVCAYPDYFSSTSLYELNYEGCDEEAKIRPLMFSLFVLTAVFVLTFLTSVITYNHFRGVFFNLYKRMVISALGEESEEAKMHKYDAYLCYAQKDFQWVENVFLKNLDSEYCKKNRFHLCFEERNFIPGEDHFVNIRDAIWNSKKTICIVTKQFMKDGWCVEAFNYAQSRYFTELKDSLIMVVVGSISEYQLRKYKPIRAYIQRCQYLTWPEDYQDIDWFLSRLSYKILKERKVENKEVQVKTVMSTVELHQIEQVT
ncbi:toll-like receptor 5 isoform X2 [Hyperolius riggenbachi]